MKKYKNLGGNSGIASYELAPGFIAVTFSDGWIYDYTDQSAGASKVVEMQSLAEKGCGLNSFINRYARKLYAKKYRL